VVAFQRARKALGNEFIQATKKTQYYEVVDVNQQIKMLSRDRVYVSVGDKFMFTWNVNKNNKNLILKIIK